MCLEDVKQQLGHSSITLTSSTYGHVLAQRQRVVARVMDAVLGGWQSAPARGGERAHGSSGRGTGQPIGCGFPRTGQRKSAAASRTSVSFPAATRDWSSSQLVTSSVGSPVAVQAA